MLKNIVIVYIVESLLYFMVSYTMFYTSDSEAVLIQKMISPPFKSVLHMIYPTLITHKKINSFFCGYLLMLTGTYTPYFQNLKFNIIFIFIYSVLFLGADPHFSDSISLTPPFEPAFF